MKKDETSLRMVAPGSVFVVTEYYRREPRNSSLLAAGERLGAAMPRPEPDHELGPRATSCNTRSRTGPIPCSVLGRFDFRSGVLPGYGSEGLLVRIGAMLVARPREREEERVAPHVDLDAGMLA
jgi:hypothetical protein